MSRRQLPWSIGLEIGKAMQGSDQRFSQCSPEKEEDALAWQSANLLLESVLLPSRGKMPLSQLVRIA